MIYFNCVVQAILLLGILRVLWVLKEVETNIVSELDAFREQRDQDDKSYEVDLNRRLSELQSRRFSHMRIVKNEPERDK